VLLRTLLFFLKQELPMFTNLTLREMLERAITGCHSLKCNEVTGMIYTVMDPPM
jgi:hypothetical protein